MYAALIGNLHLELARLAADTGVDADPPAVDAESIHYLLHAVTITILLVVLRMLVNMGGTARRPTKRD